MAILEELNAHLQALQVRQDGIDNSTPTITPGNGVYSITYAVTAATDAAEAADASKDTAASAASVAAGYAGVAKTARDTAVYSASAASNYAAHAESSKSAAATSATNAAASATTATGAKTAAETAAANALEAYSGAIDAYSGTVEIYSEMSALRDNIIDGLNKLDNALYSVFSIETSGAADAATLNLINPQHHTIYYSAGAAVEQLNITYDDSYIQSCIENPQYVTELHYIASTNDPKASYPADVIYWSGNDCARGIFTPSSQTVYDIVISSNLQRLRGYVSGTPNAMAVAMLSLDW